MSVKSKMMSYVQRLRYSRSTRAKMARIFILGLVLSLVAFILNGIIVGSALLYTSKRGYQALDLKKVKVSDLCKDVGKIEVEGKLDSKALKLFSIEITEPVDVEISVEKETLFTLQIPQFSIGKDANELKFIGDDTIDLLLNQQANLKKVVKYISKNPEQTKHVKIKFSLMIKTYSFWIPLSFRREFEESIELVPKKFLESRASSIASATDLGVESLEFLPGEHEKKVEVLADFKIPANSIPGYLDIDFPKLTFNLSFMYDQPLSPQSPLADFSIEGQEINSSSSSFRLGIKTKENYKKNLFNVLESIKDGKNNFDLSLSTANFPYTCAPGDLSCRPCTCGLQKFFQSFEASAPFEKLSKQVLTPMSSSYQPAGLTEKLDAPMIISLGLENVSQLDQISTFKFRLGVNKKFISTLLPFRIDSIKGDFPSICLKNILQKGKENKVIARFEIKHAPDISKESEETFNFDINLEVHDFAVATQIVIHAAGTKMANITTEDIRALFDRLYVTGEEDKSLFSYLASVYEVNVPILDFSKTPGGIKLGSLPLDFGGYVFSSPQKQLSESRHEMNFNLEDSAAHFTLFANIKFQDKPLIPNPVFHFYWKKDISFTLTEGSKITSQIFEVKLNEGCIHTSLAPANPINLVHNGNLVASLKGYDVPGFKSLFKQLMDKQDVENFFIIKAAMGKGLGSKVTEVELKLPFKDLFPIITDYSTSKFPKVAPQIRLAGLKDSTINTLLKFATSEKPEKSLVNSTILFNLTLPKLNAAICLENKNGELVRGHSTKMIVSGDLTNLKKVTRLEYAVIETGREKEKFSKWMPLSFYIINFVKLVESFDKVLSGSEPVTLSLSPSEEEESFINRLISGIGSIPKYPPQIERSKRSIISRVTREHAKLSIKVKSPDWSKILPNDPSTFHLKASLKLPHDCFIDDSQDSNGKIKDEETIVAGTDSKLNNEEQPLDDAFSIQWGDISLEFEADGSKLCLNIDKGFVKLRNEITEESHLNRFDLLSNGYSRKFKANLFLSMAKGEVVQKKRRSFNSHDLRKIINELFNYIKKVDEKPNCIDKIVKFNACLKRYDGEDDEVKSGEIGLHVKTLLNAARIIYNRYSSKPNEPNNLMSEWTAELRVRKADNVVFDVPCVFPFICQDGLLERESHQNLLGVVDVTLKIMTRAMAEAIAHFTGPLISKILLPKYPKVLEINTKFDCDLKITGSVNGNIDIAEATIPANYFNLSRLTTIVYPGEELTEVQKDEIRNDSQTYTMTLKLAKYYHDLSGLVKYIQIDPFLDVELEPKPLLKEFPKLSFSHLNFSATNERMEDSNLFSTISCILMYDNVSDPVFSEVKASSLVNDPFIYEHLEKLETVFRGVQIPNPTTKFDLIIEGFDATYFVKRKNPFSDVPPGDFGIMTGVLEPYFESIKEELKGRNKELEGSRYIFEFKHGTTKKASMRARCNYTVFQTDKSKKIDPAVAKQGEQLADEVLFDYASGNKLNMVLKGTISEDLNFIARFSFSERAPKQSKINTEGLPGTSRWGIWGMNRYLGAKSYVYRASSFISGAIPKRVKNLLLR